jgi:hypothetical protein
MGGGRGIRRDLFGFIDLVAFTGRNAFAIQATGRAHLPDTIEKLSHDPRVAPCVRAWIECPEVPRLVVVSFDVKRARPRKSGTRPVKSGPLCSTFLVIPATVGGSRPQFEPIFEALTIEEAERRLRSSL